MRIRLAKQDREELKEYLILFWKLRELRTFPNDRNMEFEVSKLLNYIGKLESAIQGIFYDLINEKKILQKDFTKIAKALNIFEEDLRR